MLPRRLLRAPVMLTSMFPEDIRPSQPARKNEGCTVIAHISDLHFTSKTNSDDFVWNALLSDLKSRGEKVDLIAVTGDLIDAPFSGLFGRKDEAGEAFLKSRGYLEQLCVELGIDPACGLVVVPGNHDFRLKGLIHKRAQPAKFHRAFKDWFRPVLLPSLGLCIIVLDSNAIERGLNLATGMVERNVLVEFENFLKTLQEKHADGMDSCTKVVMLHHHPMPIAATELTGALEQPGFLLLKNAGQFMTSMVKGEVDLVLHGHQHCPAYSKASYPTENSHEHMIMVVGAGSVGEEANGFKRSYNLITITDNRQIHLERRAMPAAGYERAFKVALRSYEDARRITFEGLARKADAKLRMRKFSRLYIIRSGSGDAEVFERSEGVRAFGPSIARLPTALHSIQGDFTTPAYTTDDDQTVTWEWLDPIPVKGKRRADIHFQPALTREREIETACHYRAHNLFHFNRQDRLWAARGKSDREFIQFSFRNAFDLFVLTVCFPEGHFPRKFYRLVHDTRCPRAAHDEQCAREPFEQEYFDLRFSKFEGARSVVVSLERPLPGYTYSIAWDLPEFDGSGRRLTAQEMGRVKELNKRLLSLCGAHSRHSEGVRDWLTSLRDSLLRTQMWQELKGADDLEVSLYSKDDEKMGLVCVAALNPGFGDRPWEGTVDLGKNIVGSAYKRREPMIYSPHVNRGELEYRIRVPEFWIQGDGQDYAVICAIPLLYPDPLGRKVGVLTLASRSNTSKLLNFIPGDRGARGAAEEEQFADARDALVDDIMTRQMVKLAEALGL